MKIVNYLIVFILLVGNCQAIEIIPKNEESYTCYDYAIEFKENNPEWGILTISNNKYFYGNSHMVNYKVINKNELLIHDEMYGSEYNFAGWRKSGYYHFWGENEIPKRNYKLLFDNREVII